MGLGKFLKKAVGATVGSLGGLGGVAGIATDVLGAVLGHNAQEDANKMNYKIHRENLEWNKPINQMKRFEEAGLNPNLIYTQGNAGNATAQPVMKAESYDIHPSQSIANALSFQNLRAQNENLKAQNNLLASQSAAAAENARRAKLENDFFQKYHYWPGQESALIRGLRGFTGYLPQLYFNSVEGASDLIFGKPAPRGMNKVDWNPRRG